jgi:hypothetical protein
MLIIGVDYPPSDQYIAFIDTKTGECGERRLNHSDGEAEKFYRGLQSRAASVRVGMEATGYSRWFERLLAELGIELWIGDAAELVEAAQAAVHCDADWRRRYLHLAMRRERNIAKVAMARRLAVRLYWMWRNGWEYPELVKFGSNAGQLGTGHAVQ